VSDGDTLPLFVDCFLEFVLESCLGGQRPVLFVLIGPELVPPVVLELVRGIDILHFALDVRGPLAPIFAWRALDGGG